MVALDAGHLLRLRAVAQRRAMARSVTSMPGGFVTRPRGHGLEIAELRAFADGDDPRHIDRNATARSGRLHVRTFHAERDRTMLLVADFRPSMLWGTRRTFRSVAAAEALCLAGWHAVADGARVGALTITATGHGFVRPRARARAMVRVIGELVGAHKRALVTATDPDPPLAEALDLTRRVAPKGAEIMLASALDNLGTGYDHTISAIRRRATLSVVRIADAFELAPPRGRYRFATPGGHAGTAAPHGDGLAEPDTDGVIFEVARPPDEQAFLA